MAKGKNKKISLIDSKLESGNDLHVGDTYITNNHNTYPTPPNSPKNVSKRNIVFSVSILITLSLGIILSFEECNFLKIEDHSQNTDENIPDLYQSEVIPDDGPFEILTSWQPISPCQELALDKKYIISVFDEDPFDTNDFIGKLEFRPSDYLAEQDERVRLSDGKITLTIDLSWQ